jgi:PAS domain-containing protein
VNATATDIPDEPQALRIRLAEAEDTLRAIRQGEIDALVVEGPKGHRIYTLEGADEPYRMLVEEMHEGAAVLTGRGDILYANTRFAALAGEPLTSSDFCARRTETNSRACCAPVAAGFAAA